MDKIENMNIEDFVKQMMEIKPDELRLVNEGFTETHISVIRNNFIILPRSSDFNDVGRNLVETLIEKYFAEYIRFGDFSFLKEIKEIGRFKVFGASSYSFLAISPLGEILELDIEENSLLNRVAENSEFFLRALVCVSELFSKRLQGLVDRSDDIINNEYLSKVVEFAGGKKYLNFYRQLIY